MARVVEEQEAEVDAQALADTAEEDEQHDASSDSDAESDEPEGEQDGADQDEGEADEVVVSIGDDETDTEAEAQRQQENRAPQWTRDLRKANRDQAKRIRELEQRDQQRQTVQVAPAVGEKPKLEDLDYDAQKFEVALEAWHGRKAAAVAEQSKREAQQASEKHAWDARLANHAKLRGELKVRDYDDAEAAVDDALSVTQRGLIVHGAENSAQVFYALGKNPKVMKELADITDPVLFAFRVAKLETKLKVAPRKTAPVPERQIRGNASPGSTDSTLARLQAEADRTGDRSKVAEYRRKQRRAA